jgi:dihydrofolate reductase / thymidylate synthase
MKHFSIIVCRCINNGIGYKNSLPWKITSETKHFSEVTIGNGSNAIIMGRKTFESIGKPLPRRLNIVLTKSKIPNVVCFSDLDQALSYCNECENIYVIGGESLYKIALEHPNCVNIIDTLLYSPYTCDRFFEIPDHFNYVSSTNLIYDIDLNDDKPVTYSIKKWERVNLEEKEYLKMLSNIISDGELKNNRTGIKTLSLFGNQLRFSLHYDQFPLITTKSVPLRLVFEELMWFIRGDTNVNNLKKQEVHIWDANTSRETLDKMGKQNVEEGTLEYGYGFQWRHFGDKYINKHHKHNGFDQINYIINELKTNKYSRRIILTAWNPENIDKSVLPPCHVMYIFNVNMNDELSCMLVMRSSDAPLGLPFNIASTALLTKMLAQICGLGVNEIVCSLADTHIYENQIEGVKELIQRSPRLFPILNFKRKPSDITDYKWEDIVLTNYNPHPKINIPMAV